MIYVLASLQHDRELAGEIRYCCPRQAPIEVDICVQEFPQLAALANFIGVQQKIVLAMQSVGDGRRTRRIDDAVQPLAPRIDSNVTKLRHVLPFETYAAQDFAQRGGAGDHLAQPVFIHALHSGCAGGVMDFHMARARENEPMRHLIGRE